MSMIVLLYWKETNFQTKDKIMNQTLNLFMIRYKYSWLNHPESGGAKLYEASRDALYTNGQPLNILKACIILKEAASLVRIDYMKDIHFELLLRYISKVSGYGVTELMSRIS